MSASSAAPPILPVTIVTRDNGATSADCRNPACRSSMIEMVEKMAVNRMMSTMIQQMPGIMDQARLSTAKLPAPRQLKDLPLKDQARIKQLLGMPAKGK